uniref:J domain-containing protein n=1 Tax=Kalanchoe fedtschenkoi TaxID=63787 RepID=A0A7N0SWX3_KALFE
MDHYEILGLNRKATKGEIKEAFKKLAMKFHPDKHSGSSKSVKEGATMRFKQVSEAYEVLMDDRKRADYDFRYGSARGSGGGFSASSSSSYHYRNPYGYGYGATGQNTWYGHANGGGGFRVEALFRFLSTRAFLINAAFARFKSAVICCTGLNKDLFQYG